MQHFDVSVSTRVRAGSVTDDWAVAMLPCRLSAYFAGPAAKLQSCTQCLNLGPLLYYTHSDILYYCYCGHDRYTVSVIGFPFFRFPFFLMHFDFPFSISVFPFSLLFGSQCVDSSLTNRLATWLPERRTF